MISLDTETTGVDFFHGARPFFVTTCNEQGEQHYWEWDVNPLNRKPTIPVKDAREIRALLNSNSNLILQNPKFDAAALEAANIILEWPWSKTHDTLSASHILASNQPHDLTSLAIQYLGYNPQPLEDKLKEACTQARSLARSKFPSWRIAKEGLPDMPSAKGGKGRESRGAESEKPWKFDCWLPRALAKQLDYPPDHPWWTVTRNYSNDDSATTLLVWRAVEEELYRRGLWEIYLTKIKVLPVVDKMYLRGVSMSGANLTELTAEFNHEVAKQSTTCLKIAHNHNYDLTLPKGGRNNSLIAFCFEHLKLPVVKHTKGGNESFDKEAIADYLALLPEGEPRQFVNSFRIRQKRSTSLTYMESYQRFWIPVEGMPGQPQLTSSTGWWRIHPNLNPTGTDTLRFSCSNPNEQNISKQESECEWCQGEGCKACGGTGFNRSVRYCFGPMPGREWYSFDAKNIELRIPFYKSGEEALILLFEHPDDPPYYGSNHLANFHAVYPEIWAKELKEVGIEKVGPHCKKKYASSYYQWCKNGGFAKQYGGQRRKVDTTFHRDGAFDLLDSKFSRLAELNRQQIAFANRHGYVETVPDVTVNPKHGYPLLCTRTEYGKVLETVPLSYHVQGTAMWWTIKAMIRVHEQLEQWHKEEPSFDGFITMQVHDELVLDFPKGRISPVEEASRKTNQRKSNLWRVRKIQDLMTQGGDDIGVPTPVGCEYHEHNWSKGVSL